MIEPGGATKKSSENNKTGSWRTFRPVVTDKCTGCGQCVKTCPDGTIKLVDRNDNTKFKKKAEIDYDFCKGCLICMEVCPFKAIEKKLE